MIVHHASKKQRSQPGQALRGSSDLHAIGDCNAYLARKGAHLVLTIEHRAARSPEPLMIELACDESMESVALRVCDAGLKSADDQQPSLPERTMKILEQAKNPLSRTALRAGLRVNNQKLGAALSTLEDQGRIRRIDKGWMLTDSTIELPGETDVGSAEVQPTEG